MSGEITAGMVDLVIGEVATFAAAMIFPFGTSSSSVLSFTFPTGFLPINGTVTSTGGVSSSLTTGSSGTVSSNVVTFTLGTVVNAPSSNTGNFMVQLYAVVQNVSSNYAGVTLTTVTSASTLAIASSPLSVSNSLQLVESALTLTQSVSPTTNVQAGSTFTYTLVLSMLATSTAPAYNVTIADTLPSYVVLVSATVSPTNNGYSLATGTNSIAYSLPTYALGSSAVTITVTATVAATSVVGVTINNTATGGWQSAPQTLYPSTVRSYALPSSTTSVATNTPSIAWTISSTSLSTPVAPLVAVGETVSYQLTLVIPPGVTNLQLGVSLPNSASGYLGLISSQIVSVSITLPGALLLVGTSGTPSNLNADGSYDSVTFNLGNNLAVLTPNATVVFQVVAVVNNIPTNVKGITMKPTATLTYGSSSMVFTLASSPTTSLTVVEPSFGTATKTSNSTSVNGGDIILYNVR